MNPFVGDLSDKRGVSDIKESRPHKLSCTKIMWQYSMISMISKRSCILLIGFLIPFKICCGQVMVGTDVNGNPVTVVNPMGPYPVSGQDKNLMQAIQGQRYFQSKDREDRQEAVQNYEMERKQLEDSRAAQAHAATVQIAGALADLKPTDSDAPQVLGKLKEYAWANYVPPQVQEQLFGPLTAQLAERQKNQDLSGIRLSDTNDVEQRKHLTDALDYLQRGIAKLSKKDLEGAISDCDKAVELNPKDGRAYFFRGEAKQSKNDLEGAIADYNKAIELNPKDDSAYLGRGLTKQAKNDLNGAIIDYDKAVELNTKYTRTYFFRGEAKLAKKDLNGAIADYDKAVELNPKDANAYLNRGFAKLAKKDLEGAIVDYDKAIELNPKDALAYRSLGKVKNIMYAWMDALLDYRYACEVSESEDDKDYPHLNIWLIRSRLGETDAASKELSTYMEKRWKAAPGDWVSKVAGFLLGTVTEADLFGAATSSDTEKDKGQHCEAWYYSGMKKLLSGDKKTAVDYFHKCLATEMKSYDEYKLAQSELKSLGE